MTIKEAMNIFNISTVEEIEVTNIKKIWRRIMLKVHPDSGGEHEEAVKYNTAYEVLKEYAEKATQNNKQAEYVKEPTYVVSLEDFIGVYRGNPVKILVIKDNETSEVLLSRDNIKAKRVIIEVPVEITYNGIMESHTYMVIQNSKDMYDITVQVKEADITSESYTKLTVLNKTIETTMKDTILKFLFRLDYNINVVVQVERMIINA